MTGGSLEGYTEDCQAEMNGKAFWEEDRAAHGAEMAAHTRGSHTLSDLLSAGGTLGWVGMEGRKQWILCRPEGTTVVCDMQGHCLLTLPRSGV